MPDNLNPEREIGRKVGVANLFGYTIEWSKLAQLWIMTDVKTAGDYAEWTPTGFSKIGPFDILTLCARLRGERTCHPFASDDPFGDD